MTAAHCFNGVNLKQLENNLEGLKVIVQGQVRKVCAVHIHSAYDLKGGQGQPYDVAVLTLEPPVQNPKPIKVASAKQKDNLEKPGSKVTVVGQGKKAQVRISGDKNGNVWSFYDPNLHIVTYNKKKHVTPGDSGGPLLVKKCTKGKCRYVQIGIVAQGAGYTKGLCDLFWKKCPDVYTEVNNPSIRNFITKAKKASCPKEAPKPPKPSGGGNQGGGNPTPDQPSGGSTDPGTPDLGSSAPPDPGSCAIPGCVS